MRRFHHDPWQRGRRLAAGRPRAAARDAGDRFPAAANPAHVPEMPATLLARADEVIE
jgi:hypothetical protein